MLPLVVACADVAAAAVAVTVAARLSYGSASTVVRIGDHIVEHELVSLIAVPTWCLTLAVHGAYAPSVVGSVTEEPRRVLRGSVAFFSLVAVVDLLWTGNLSSRWVIVLAVTAALLTLVVRVVGARIVQQARQHHRWMRRAVVYGGGVEAGALARLMADAPHLGVEVVGTCTAGAAPDGETALPRTGNGERPSSEEADDQVLHLVSSTGADMLAVTAGTPSNRLRSLAWRLEGTGVDVMVAPAVTDVARHAVAVFPVGDLPLLRVEGCRIARFRLIAKNMIDGVGATLLLVLLSPVMIAAAVAIKLTSPGPVLYHQSRVGHHGRVFSFLKFRTMVCDADALLTDLLGCNESDGLLFKIHDDPRVTAVGRVLRRYSIDELPQLWNVVRGDMSLVGPRPLPVSPEALTGDARRRLRVKPGITGLWQVSGRSELGWDDTVRIDMDYVDRWSLLLDLKILLRTPAAVLRGRGAY